MAHTEAELADELHISDDTVRTHVPSAMTKPGARSRAPLVAKAFGDRPLARLNQSSRGSLLSPKEPTSS